MSKIKITLTRSDTNAPWFTTTSKNVTDYFTAEELTTIVMPHKAMVESTTGFISRTTIDLDNFRRQIITEYDTLEHAQTAFQAVTGKIPNHIGSTYGLLLEKKRTELGLNYIVETVIEE